MGKRHLHETMQVNAADTGEWFWVNKEFCKQNTACAKRCDFWWMIPRKMEWRSPGGKEQRPSSWEFRRPVDSHSSPFSRRLTPLNKSKYMGVEISTPIYLLLFKGVSLLLKGLEWLSTGLRNSQEDGLCSFPPGLLHSIFLGIIHQKSHLFAHAVFCLQNSLFTQNHSPVSAALTCIVSCKCLLPMCQNRKITWQLHFPRLF